MSGSRVRAHRVVVVAIAIAALALILLLGPESTGAQELDDPPIGTDESIDDEVTTTTGSELLVPGDGSDGAQSTTTSPTSVVQASEARGDGLSETTAVWAIVGGLVAVAIGISWWTIRYWKRTSPGSSAKPRPSRRARTASPDPDPDPPQRRRPDNRERRGAPERVVEPGATTRTPAERQAVRRASAGRGSVARPEQAREPGDTRPRRVRTQARGPARPGEGPTRRPAPRR